MNNSEKMNLKRSIMQICFSLYDCRLFLDTHPNCTEAINYYERLHNTFLRLHDEYSSKYGMLSAYSSVENNDWNWNEGKMPWEGDN